MENLNKVFTEQQVNDISSKVLKTSIAKITDELQGKFSQEMESWIYEHYLNVKNKIEKELIRDITEEFVQDPMQYKFAKLREKLFLENKELLVKTLTDEAIMLSVENVLEKYTHRNHQFDWKWKDAILKFISENWHKFKDDERVNSGLIRDIDMLKSQINILKMKINELENKDF